MEKDTIVLKSCTRTLGKPFEGEEARCPLFRKIDSYYVSGGWQQKNYNAFKTGIGDKCIVKYEKAMREELGGEKDRVLLTLEVDIEGTENRCSLHVMVDSFRPEDKTKSLGHRSEREILKGICALVTEMPQYY